VIPKGPEPPDTDPHSAKGQTSPRRVERAVAALEVVLCSDYPTQFALTATFSALGYPPFVNNHLVTASVVAMSLADTALLLGLIVLFICAHGERPRDLFLGTRSSVSEAIAGVLMAIVAIGLGVLVLAVLQRVAPWLHTVEHNPMQDLIQTRRDAWLFALVVVIAGGVREELQRAFLLHRFEVWLGGAGVGLVFTSVVFGAGHLGQGADAAIAIGTLGAFWGVVYLWRRSSVAPIVSHAGFDLLQIVQFLMVGRK
jgi:membrane protease YdiL (CAAX protease family)